MADAIVYILVYSIPALAMLYYIIQYLREDKTFDAAKETLKEDDYFAVLKNAFLQYDKEILNCTKQDIELILVNASNDYLKFIEETYLNNTTYQKSLINGCRTNIINYEFNNIPFSLGKLYAIRYYVEYRTPAKQKKIDQLNSIFTTFITSSEGVLNYTIHPDAAISNYFSLTELMHIKKVLYGICGTYLSTSSRISKKELSDDDITATNYKTKNNVPLQTDSVFKQKDIPTHQTPLEESQPKKTYKRKYATSQSSINHTNKNQKDFDYYLKRHKEDWELGRDYELYIGQRYEALGYSVEYFGTEQKYHDLGRDLIAKKDNEILIIQCKNFGKYHNIYENAITQLYGTTEAYKKENNIGDDLFTVVKPVFITTKEVMDSAKEMAKTLNVQIIENTKLEDFPRIKCNISNKGEKIYHLPCDPQYDRVRIKNNGECYAHTIDEAERKGFRRTKR